MSKRNKANELDDLIGKQKKARKPKKVVKVKDELADLIGVPRPKKVVEIGGVGYEPLVKPKVPHPDGLWARREQKGKNWGVTCLECNDKLHYRGGRPPVVCKKKDCYRAYRNLYRRDYDKQRATA